LHYRVKVRKNGQITIPYQLRKELGWTEGTLLEITSEKGGIHIRKVIEDETGNPPSKH
jgi:AbrB family looped-hinge helix DNA binding protein